MGFARQRPQAGERLLVGRIQALAIKTSQQASASLRFANAQVCRAHRPAGSAPELEARRKTAAG
jgi:hypothetical protein